MGLNRNENVVIPINTRWASCGLISKARRTGVPSFPSGRGSADQRCSAETDQTGDCRSGPCSCGLLEFALQGLDGALKHVTLDPALFIGNRMEGFDRLLERLNIHLNVVAGRIVTGARLACTSGSRTGACRLGNFTACSIGEGKVKHAVHQELAAPRRHCPGRVVAIIEKAYAAVLAFAQRAR
jgi:hypothetical protein